MGPNRARLATALLATTAFAAPALAGGTTTPLYAVSGNSGANPESLFRVSTDDASLGLLTALGNGDDGESIAFNPLDRQLYHWSGRGSQNVDSIMETVDPDTFVVNPITWDGMHGVDPMFAEETEGATFDRATGSFFVCDLDRYLYSVSTSGIVTTIGLMDHLAKGMVIFDNVLYSLDNTDPGVGGGGTGANLRTIDPLTGATLTTTGVSLAGVTINNGLALALDPATNTFWAVLKEGLGSAQVRHLVTIDPATGVASPVGTLNQRIASIAFVPPPDSLFVGVTGDGATTPEALYFIEPNTAELLFGRLLGNGNDGEEIAFSTRERQLFHWSGRGDEPTTISVMEKIAEIGGAITDIPWDHLHGASVNHAEEAKAAVYDAASDTFLLGDIDRYLYRVSPTGTVQPIGFCDHLIKGQAFHNGALYSVAQNDANLRIINPANAATLTSIPMSTPGIVINRGISLATDPATNVMYAVLQGPGGGSDRYLATINPNTGVASLRGALTDRIASIDFVPPETCPVDFTRDGLVNLDDLQILLFNFGQAGTVLEGDANRDGFVNLDDLQLLLFLFGSTCPTQ
ncbi:MAG: hypothetical protein KDA20_05125 [Phycisphaerales bacterium]|nr:hypothetical protein [Phycisphaerales bacterium]